MDFDFNLNYNAIKKNFNFTLITLIFSIIRCVVKNTTILPTLYQM